MTRKSDAEYLMDGVPDDGRSVGNKTLMTQLPWKEEKFWRVREELLNEGKIERGKGKGGSVRRLLKSAQLPIMKSQRNSPEAKLYDPLLEVLKKDWARERGIEPNHIHFEITAKQGKRAGGTWTRPDITAVSVRTFQHLPNKYVDIWTFEVKSVDALDVTAIFEAVAHSSRATRSYALLQVPDQPDDRAIELINRCELEASRLRVGLITFSSETDFSTWETLVVAPRLDTTPEALEEFIGNLSELAKKRLGQWKQ